MSSTDNNDNTRKGDQWVDPGSHTSGDFSPAPNSGQATVKPDLTYTRIRPGGSDCGPERGRGQR